MHNLCDFFSKIIFDRRLFSYCCHKFDYPESIVYLSCAVEFYPILTKFFIIWIFVEVFTCGLHPFDNFGAFNFIFKILQAKILKNHQFLSLHFSKIESMISSEPCGISTFREKRYSNEFYEISSACFLHGGPPHRLDMRLER